MRVSCLITVLCFLMDGHFSEHEYAAATAYFVLYPFRLG